MPKVKTFDDDGYDTLPPRNEASVSSVVFGLMMIVALVVSAAAWMGGSMAKVEASIGNVLDGVARTTGLAVESVMVLGLENDPELREQVLAAAMIEPGENMWRADPHRIRRRIDETGRVVDTSVHRLWPNQVVIQASPAKAAALWHDGENWHVVDTLGRVMAREPAAAYPSLVRVSGAGAQAAVPVLRAALDAAPSLDGRLKVAQLVGGRRWDILLDTGLVLRMPGEAALADALVRFERLDAAEGLSARPLRLADFRVADRVFLRPEIPGDAAGTPRAAGQTSDAGRAA